jgi:membrane protease YdiL (CAAX protease family)
MHNESTPSSSSIQPMSLGASLLFFGLPALAVAVAFHVGMPALIAGGLAPFYAYTISLCIPLAGMLIASLVAYRMEGNPSTWPALQARFRLDRMDGKAWVWAAATFVVMFLGSGILGQVERVLIANGLMPMPNSLPAFLDPRTTLSLQAFDQAFGGLAGNGLAIVACVVLLFFNIVGEEFWWRGYILPRNELAFGKWTWLIHGLLWALFHVFKWWNLLAVLAMTLPLTFMVWRLKNTTAGIVVHAVFNGMVLIPIVLGIFGLGG